MAIESVATTKTSDSNGTGFAFIPRSGRHLFHIAQDAPQDALRAHLSCTLAAMREITSDCEGDAPVSIVWLLNALAEQAEAITDAMEPRVRLGNILADAATLPDSDLAVLQTWLRSIRNGLEMDIDSLRSASDADVRAIVGMRAAA